MSDPLNASVTVPDITVWFRKWRKWSDEVRVAIPHERDLRYGPSEDETLDLFVPRPGAPLLVFFHGGYWRRLHKDDFTYIARAFSPHGVATAIVNYSLSPAVPIETIVAQAQRSVAWLREHGESHGISSSEIVVGGHSAGGHLAAMCAVDMPVHAVVTLSGLHDMRAAVGSFMNEWLQLDETRAAAVSPTLLEPAAPCTVVALAGELESDAFKAQGRDFVAAWREHGCVGTYDDSPGDNHYTEIDRLYEPDDPLTLRIAQLTSTRRVSP